jgi:hypothetical protein
VSERWDGTWVIYPKAHMVADKYEDIWNINETMCALGVFTNAQVLASSTKKKAYIKSPEDREWISIIETISATGVKLQCLVIFKGKHLQST